MWGICVHLHKNYKKLNYRKLNKIEDDDYTIHR